MKPCDRYVRSAAAAAIAAVALTPLPCAARQYSPNGGSTLNSYTSPYAGMTQSSRGQKLEVATFNLAPPGVIGENIEQARAVANSTVDVVRTLLYSQGGEQAAAVQGRRMWFDRNTLQLTVTDHPEHIRRVSDYLRSLSAPGSKKRSEIVFLKHQTASDVRSLVGQATGTEGGAGAQQGGESVTRTLRVEGELAFRDLRIRVTRVNENDAADRNDDSVEMVIRTPTNSEDRTIEEFRSEFVDAYEINVIEVRPSGTAGEGSARIEVRHNPAATGR